MTSALPAAPATTSADAGGIEQLRAAFDRVPGYLNAASLGLPPRAVTAAMTEAVAAWTAGRGCPVEYDASVNESRELYARLVGVPAGHVAVGSQVSVFAGLVAASLPDGAEVVCVDGDFSSMVYPFMVHADRGVTVRHVPLAELPDALTERTTMVAFSLAQSACGSLADGDAVVAAARRVGALTFCDLTQAAGWMPVDAAAFDLTVCSAYKWLCAPRGTAFLTVAPDVAETIRPVNAGWYAGASVWDSCYGPTMQLADDARRFDVSPAWLSWVGTVPALRLFAGADMTAVRGWDAGLADALRARLGSEPCGRPVVSLPDPDGRRMAALEQAGMRVAGRAGKVRIAFHLWNSSDDVDAAARALR
ncbi:MAG TPA: aminotransferase class V-fold PLP-dependent enzyme [Actinomycetales bacterium]|nr:aminotransferase class V-fold PLP-dependent enzyme [Actinomycetales bacterium]